MGEDRTARPGPNEQRLTVREASEALGISAEAVRMRIKRGTLTSEREGGRVYVLLGRRPTREQPTEQPTDHTEELIATLQKQLEAEREANRENRRIIAALTSRIPELDAPSETPQAPETASEAADKGETQGATEPRSRAPWWRRLIGG